MYLSMGHMMWGWPLPVFLEGNHVSMGAGAAPVNDNHYGDQSEVFYQWMERHDP